uniref:Uncharacterized protein n=1 Tax=Chrysemys picta bellii TaxID=8478 RepID=A0A8C3IHZ9_CHRPI
MSAGVSNLSGLLGRSCCVHPLLTLLRSADTVRSGWAVSGSRVTFAAERESEREGQSSALGEGLILSVQNLPQLGSESENLPAPGFTQLCLGSSAEISAMGKICAATSNMLLSSCQMQN